VHLSQWIEAHPHRARQLGLRIAAVRRVFCGLTQLHLVWIPLLWLEGYVPTQAAVLCAASTLHALWVMSPAVWPARRDRTRLPAVVHTSVSFVLPLCAHMALTSHYGQVQGAWAELRHGMRHDVPLLPETRALEVVALIAGLVWALPVWQFVSETTQEWMLPSAEQAS